MLSSTMPDSELKARHRAMWASGDYPSMVETFLLPLGPRLVEACGIGPGMRVLDVAAGTGNASIPAAQRGARGDRQRPHARAARGRARRAPRPRALELDWVEADAEHLPFDDASFDVVMSSIGAMFAPHHQAAADELVRVCRPGRHDRAAELDARGHDRRAVPHDGAVRAAAAARRAAAAAVGQRGAPARAVRRPRRVRHARARRARGHRVRAAARLRRALQGALRPDDRRPGERAPQRPRGGVRRGARPLLRRVEPRHARRGALRAGVPRSPWGWGRSERLAEPRQPQP